MAQEMKDSGIEWIGKIPANWQVCKQKHVIELINGRAYSDDEFEDGGKYRILRVGNLFTNPAWYTSSMELDSSKYCEDGDLLYAWSMSYAPVIWHGEKVIYHYHIWKVDLSILIDKLFAFYYLKVVTDALMAEKHETTMSFITMGVMNNSYIAYPDISDQHRIAAFLDRKCAEIDSIIADTQKTIEEYKALKQSIITEAVTKGVRGERKMKDSGVEWIGDVPEEWKVIKCSRIISGTQNGLTRRDTEKSEGDIVLKLKNIDSNGYIDYSEVNRISLTTKEIETYKLQEGDFLFVRVNGSKSLVGKCAIYHDVGSIVAYNDHIIRVQLNELCSREYFKLYLQSNCGKCEIDLHTSTSAGQFTISGEGLRDMVFVLPPMKEQVEIVEHVSFSLSQIDAIIIDKQQLLTELESYKKSVIYEYVTGKKEVQ